MESLHACDSPYTEEERQVMPHSTYHVLFVCTGNSARSIMAESVLNRLGNGTFKAYSAGSQPKGTVHPYALAVLQEHHYDTVGLRSKSWDEFVRPGAPPLDITITLCDQAAQEACPVMPGHPVSAHWSLPDPAAVDGSEAEQQQAFVQTLQVLTQRITALMHLYAPDRHTLYQHLQAMQTGLQEEE
jgi:protein-tyrosine-phosphatase